MRGDIDSNFLGPILTITFICFLSYNSSTISGSPPWMAPEQINGSCLSLKVDVWAYGVIMWEIAMEMPPYSDIPNTMNSLRTAINEKGLPLPTDHALKGLPEDVRKLYQKLFSLLQMQHPSLRPTAAQTLEAIESLNSVVAHHSKDSHDKSSKDYLSKCADLLESLDRRSRIGTMLIEFYRVHNISKIDTIGSLLDQFEGRLEDLNESLRKRYNADLNGSYSAATASAKGTNGAQRVGQAADWADISMGGLNGTQSSIKHLYDQAAIEMEAIHYITLFQALFHFYKIYNPVQIQKIQQVLEFYKGKDDLLNQKLRETYGADLSSVNHLLVYPLIGQLATPVSHVQEHTHHPQGREVAATSSGAMVVDPACYTFINSEMILTDNLNVSSSYLFPESSPGIHLASGQALPGSIGHHLTFGTPDLTAHSFDSLLASGLNPDLAAFHTTQAALFSSHIDAAHFQG
mmetsp:Transcript_19378/g.64101  ORF Transcript_19378/g.64101 Transcript_19378/m.64101 type:complete len:461 (-) Transcript_19378:1770-3152(-)